MTDAQPPQQKPGPQYGQQQSGQPYAQQPMGQQYAQQSTGQQYGQRPQYGPAYPTPAPRKPMKATTRVLLTWGIIGVVLLVTALAAIGALNRDVYGAGGFVGRYLDALASRDANAALEMPGVQLEGDELAAAGLPEGSSSLLLRNDALSGLTDIQQISDVDQGNGVHEVRYSYSANGAYGESTFVVKSDGMRFPLVPNWAFDTSPLAAVNLAVEHTTSFSANGVDFDTRQATAPDQEPAFNNIVNLLVFSPGQYSFSVDTDFLTSESRNVLVQEPAQVHEGAVAAVPTEELHESVQEAVNAALDDCTSQAVLQPSGCPFGVVIDDRVANEPTWSLNEYPEIELEAGDDTWQIVPVEGRAEVDVDVQDLFDGSISSVNENVSFEMTGDVYVQADGAVEVRLYPVED